MDIGNRSLRFTGRGPSSDWVETFARAGYTAKGVVYIVVGVLAAQVAFGAGGATEGAQGAIQEIATAPFGQTLLVLTALGLACYAVWRFVEAVVDPDKHRTDAKGVAKRTGYAVSGLVNLGLALFAAQLLIGTGGGDDSSRAEWTARVMRQPFGLWLVGIAGAIVIGVGLRHFYRAFNATFMEKYKASEMTSTTQKWAKRAGQWGLSARGVVFVIIGLFLIQAAMRADPQETGGLGEALATLAQQPYGPWLLGLVALGLVAYGIYCFSYARYRRFATPGS